jgi:hypothetical protein
MDIPTCVGCGKTYKTQKQLSKHASGCGQNHVLTLNLIFERQEKKLKLQMRVPTCGARAFSSAAPLKRINLIEISASGKNSE